MALPLPPDEEELGRVQPETLQQPIEEPKKENNFQLKFPLDVISQKIITDLTRLPAMISIDTSAFFNNSSGVFFSNPLEDSLWVEAAGVSYSIAAIGGGSGSITIQRLQGGEGIGAGDTLFVTSIALYSDTGTTYFANLTNTGELRVINKGDRLALRTLGDLSNLRGLNVSVFLKQF